MKMAYIMNVYMRLLFFPFPKYRYYFIRTTASRE